MKLVALALAAALLPACLANVSADNAKRDAINEMIVSNLTGTCLTVLGDAQLPFNVMNMQPCDSGLSSQRFIRNSSTGTICSALNGYYLFAFGNPSHRYDFLMVAPSSAFNHQVSYWAFNQATGAIYVADDCTCVMDITDAVQDGSEPVHMNCEVDEMCNNPATNEVWHFVAAPA
jgi:hypothetical protein